MDSTQLAVVMAGGRGTRFWPWSREARPKQFLPLAGSETLLRQTVLRLQPDFTPDRVYIVTTALLAEATRALLPELPPENVLIEPEGRNTAPCLALALVHLEAKHPGATMAVLSADHFIGDEAKFRADLALAASHALTLGHLVTFGIPPTYPETGYGYIETEGSGAVLNVKAFREKPPIEQALVYLQSGRHYWNAGMFVWTLKDLRTGLASHAPEVLAPLDAWAAEGRKDADLPAAYARLPKISIDYALLEKSANVSAVPASFRWSDVGSWPALAEFTPKDEHGNAIQGEAVLHDSRNCAVYAEGRLVAGAGLDDLIIVETRDAVLVIPRERAQDVKTLVDRLQAMGRKDLL